MMETADEGLKDLETTDEIMAYVYGLLDDLEDLQPYSRLNVLVAALAKIVAHNVEPDRHDEAIGMCVENLYRMVDVMVRRGRKGIRHERQ